MSKRELTETEKALAKYEAANRDLVQAHAEWRMAGAAFDAAKKAYDSALTKKANAEDASDNARDALRAMITPPPEPRLVSPEISERVALQRFATDSPSP